MPSFSSNTTSGSIDSVGVGGVIGFIGEGTGGWIGAAAGSGSASNAGTEAVFLGRGGLMSPKSKSPVLPISAESKSGSGLKISGWKLSGVVNGSRFSSAPSSFGNLKGKSSPEDWRVLRHPSYSTAITAMTPSRIPHSRNPNSTCLPSSLCLFGHGHRFGHIHGHQT